VLFDFLSRAFSRFLATTVVVALFLLCFRLYHAHDNLLLIKATKSQSHMKKYSDGIHLVREVKKKAELICVLRFSNVEFIDWIIKTFLIIKKFTSLLTTSFWVVEDRL
jgi:hypothetical protein